TRKMGSKQNAVVDLNPLRRSFAAPHARSLSQKNEVQETEPSGSEGFAQSAKKEKPISKPLLAALSVLKRQFTPQRGAAARPVQRPLRFGLDYPGAPLTPG